MDVTRSYRLMVVAAAADRAELSLYQGLANAGVRLDLLLDPACERWEEAREKLPHLTPFHVRHRLDLAAAGTLRQRIRATRPDLLYAPLNRPLSAALLATAALPVPVIGYRGTLGHLHRWDPATRLTYRHPRLAHIVCVSDAVRDYLRDRIRVAPERLTRIYKGHDPQWYDPPEDGPSRTRAAFNLPPDAFVIGFLGHIRPVKGVDVLLRALDGLPENVHVLLAGRLDDPRVRRAARRRPRVHWAGHVRDVPAVLDLCDAVALPSRAREGLPRAAIEAMCRRRPVAASRVGGLPELLDQGRCGLLVPPGNPEALAGALRQLMADPALRHRLGEAGRRRIETHFHVRDTLHQTLALHRRILGIKSEAQD